MSALDAPAADGAPVKKSLRSKRLMRPAKAKAAHAPDDESEPAAQDPPQDEAGITGGKDRPVSTASSGHASAGNRHSAGTDTETLAADTTHEPSPVLPPLDKSSSSVSYMSADADAFVEASDTRESSHPSSHSQEGGVLAGLAGPADEPAGADESAEDLMQMLAGLQVPDEPQLTTSADTGAADLLVSGIGGLASSYSPPSSALGDKEEGPRSRRGSHSTAASPVVRPATGDSAASPISARRDSAADRASGQARRSASINGAQRRPLSMAGPEPEFVVTPTSADSTGEPARSHALGRSASLRQGAWSPDQRAPASLSPAGSGGAKKGNRRSIMLTSFVPPVGLGGGPSSKSPSRSSTESRAESVVETPADLAAMNGVVEISPGGKVSKRASYIDSQQHAVRPPSEASMSSIRLRPSAEVVMASQQQQQQTAKGALQSIGERIGGAVGIREEEEEEDDADLPEWMKEVQRRKREAQEKEDAERAAAAAARDAAFEAAMASPPAAQDEAPEQPAPPTAAETVEAPPEPAPLLDLAAALSDPSLGDVHDAAPSPVAGASSAEPKADKDDDDVPLTEVDLGSWTTEPQQPAALPRANPAPYVLRPPASADAAVSGMPTTIDKPLPPLVRGTSSTTGKQDAQPVGPDQFAVPARSIYRSLSASLGINQSPPQPPQADLAGQSGAQLVAAQERQRAASQASGSPTASAGGIFAAVSSFFGRVSMQQATPPAMHSNASSSSNLSQNTMEFPGMRPSTATARGPGSGGGGGGGGEDPAMDSLLSQLEAQNQQIMKDRKARVFAHEAPTAQEPQDGAGAGGVDWEFWGALINDYDKVTRSEPRKLAQSVYRGIPGAVRGTVWQLMAKSRGDAALGARFRRLVAQKTEPGSEEAKHEKQIRHDLARTFPKLDYFRDAAGAGQEGLFNVLRAYSLFDPEVGYCQGLSFVVGPLLLNMPDEEAFCLLVRLMHTYGLRGHFLPSMDDLQLRLYQFEHVLRENLPWLSRHFQEQGVESTMYVSQWLMTMFAYRLPIELTFRLFDVVFAEGLDCLVRVALAVLKRSQTRLLSLEFEAILQYLNDGPLFAFYSHAAPDMLVRDANQITSVNARYLERLRRQYIDEMQRRMEEEDEGHRVRAENDKLHDECSRLRAALEDVTSAHDGVLSERTAAQTQLDKQRDECARLQQRVADLEEAQRQAAQEPAAAAELQADVDRLAEKNVQLTIKNQQLEDSLQDLEAALIQIKTLYADCENDRALMTKKFEDLKRALS